MFIIFLESAQLLVASSYCGLRTDRIPGTTWAMAERGLFKTDKDASVRISSFSTYVFPRSKQTFYHIFVKTKADPE